MAESSGQLGGKDDVRQVQGPRLDTSSPDSSAATIRFVESESSGASPPQEFTVSLQAGERIVSIETAKDSFGFARARVWIERAES